MTLATRHVYRTLATRHFYRTLDTGHLIQDTWYNRTFATGHLLVLHDTCYMTLAT